MAGEVQRTGAIAAHPRAPNQRDRPSEYPSYTGVNGHNHGNNTITVTKTTTVNGNPSLR